MYHRKNKIVDICIIAVFSALLFAQEQALSFLPNIQLTVFLIVLYSKVFGFIKTIIIVCVHVLLDNIVMGSFSFHYTPFMLIGWLIIPITLSTIFKQFESNISLAILGIVFSIIYSFVMLIPNIFITEIDIFVYLIEDIPFEIILAMSSFLSILLLYNPAKKCFDRYIKA